jgi:hypothetical protein
MSRHGDAHSTSPGHRLPKDPALTPHDRTVDRTDPLQLQLSANMPAIAAALVQMCLGGSVAAISLATKLHLTFELERWDLIDRLQSRITQAHLAIERDDLWDEGGASDDAIQRVTMLQCILMAQLGKLAPSPIPPTDRGPQVQQRNGSQ